MKIKRIIGGSLESNCYIISNKAGGACYIIDPGYEAKKYIDYVEKEGLSPAGILLTHRHHDHVGAAAKVSEHFGCPVMMHDMDTYGYGGKVDRVLHHGDRLDMDGEELLVLNTPGHTEGSVCFLSDKSKVVFTGDTVFGNDLGRTDLDGSSPNAMAQSCRDIVDKWSNEFTVYPGHEDCATMKYIRANNREFLDCLKA